MKEYFLMECKLINNENTLTQDKVIELNKITLSNGENQIILKEKKIEYLFYLNENSIHFYLYIENDGYTDRIDYFIDEEYEILNLDLKIYSTFNHNEFYEHKIVKEYGQIKLDLKGQLLSSILNKEMTDESLIITGHRPDRLYGYDLNDSNYQKLAKELVDRCESFILEKDIKYFITGTTLGTEIVAFFAIDFLKKKYPNIKNILVIPFKYIYKKWQKDYIDRYNRMLSMADVVIDVDLLPEYNIPYVKKGIYHIQKMGNKNLFLTEIADNVLAFFDNNKWGHTYEFLQLSRYKQKEIETFYFKRT